MLLETDATEVAEIVKRHIGPDAGKPLRLALREFADQRGIPL